jgi:hypothetical protein
MPGLLSGLNRINEDFFQRGLNHLKPADAGGAHGKFEQALGISAGSKTKLDIVTEVIGTGYE